MESWICVTCGTQYPPGDMPPTRCPICDDARQYIGHEGQQWTTIASMQANGFHNKVQLPLDTIKGIFDSTIIL